MKKQIKIRKTNKALSKPARIAETQAFTELGFSVREIARIMKIGTNTVLRYQNKDLSEEWQQFSDTIKNVYLQQDFELAQLAVAHIKEKIGRARFFELVGLLKTVRELQKNTPLVQNNQQNNTYQMTDEQIKRILAV